MALGRQTNISVWYANKLVSSRSIFYIIYILHLPEVNTCVDLNVRKLSLLVTQNIK